jgi:hypothetical protein
VLAQEATQVFGSGFAGHALFLLVQASTALILYTGANTSFNGFPFLASYVAGDSFLPRWLLKRGHRLVFSNGIMVLTVVSVALLIVRGANVNNLVPLYAVGVFTAFSMAGFGMARYHQRRRERGWRHRLAINFSAGTLSAVVVAIFVTVKFTEGAWLVVVLFAVGIPALIRLNQEYSSESEVLETLTEAEPPPAPNYARRTIFILIDNFDLATLAAIRYAKSMRPTTIRAVHFVIDSARADKLQEQWTRAGRGVPLDFIDVPDRRITAAAAELVEREASDPATHVTVVLPRRTYSNLLGRLLHDRTADKIAAVVSRIPQSAATIVPYDVQGRVRELQARQQMRAVPDDRPDDERIISEEGEVAQRHQLPTSRTPRETARTPGVRRTVKAGDASIPIGELAEPGKYTVEGRIRVVEIRPAGQSSVLACEVSDGTGDLTAMFYGRSHIPGLVCGARVRLSGPVGLRPNSGPVMTNPAYELLFPSGEE